LKTKHDTTTMHREGRFGYIPATSSPYEILSLIYRNDLTDEEVASAYRRAALSAHPDKKDGSQEKFEQVKAASEMIRTSALRSKYQKYGSRQGPGPGDMMGNVIDKILPLVLGVLGGVLVVTFALDGSSDGFLMAGVICVVSLGSGTAISYRAPFLEVIKTGVVGTIVGGVIGSFFLIVLLLWEVLMR